MTSGVSRLARAGTTIQVVEELLGDYPMRLFLVGAALFLITATATAQSRWTVSAGPEWTRFGPFYGGRVRAEYDLTKPTSPLRLRLEGGGFWSPTQSFSGSYTIVPGTFSSTRQTVDLSFGLSVALTPLPKARFSPYVVMAAVARQSWRRWTLWQQFDGSEPRLSYGSGSAGDLLLQPGLGIRARLGSRTLQLEVRRYEHSYSATIGMQLPF